MTPKERAVKNIISTQEKVGCTYQRAKELALLETKQLIHFTRLQLNHYMKMKQKITCGGFEIQNPRLFFIRAMAFQVRVRIETEKL